jgi:lactose/L-arabinose transport system ATP-binding protein
VRLTLPIAAAALKTGDDVSLGIRPEKFAGPGQGDADLTVEVDVAEHLGNTSYVYAHVSKDERIIIEREDSRDATNKDSLTIGLVAANTFLFDHAGLRVK